MQEHHFDVVIIYENSPLFSHEQLKAILIRPWSLMNMILMHHEIYYNYLLITKNAVNIRRYVQEII